MATDLLLALLLAWQPDPGALRRLFEENEARHRNAQSARDLGGFLEQQGDTAAARAAFARALRMDEAALGAAAPQTLADAADLAKLSPPAQADGLWQRAARSPDAAVAARALAALADLRLAAGDSEAAVPLLRQALQREEAATGKDSAAVAVRLNALAPLLKPREGIPLLERALAIDGKLLGEGHPETATIRANLAGMYLDAGRADAALSAAAGAVAALEAALGPDHPRVAPAVTILAFCWRAKGDRVRAERLYRRALAIDEKAYGARHPDTLGDIRTLAEFLREGRRTREAAELEQRLR